MALLDRVLPWRATRLEDLRRAWGRRKDHARNLDAIAALHRARRERGAPGLDAQTCADLNLADIFAELDRTECPLGQQTLFDRLHTGSASPEELDAFERLVENLSANSERREQLQLALQMLRNPASMDLWSLTEPDVLPDTPWYRVFPVLALGSLAAVAMMPFKPGALLLLLASTLVSIALRVTIASWLLVVAGPFRQIGPLLQVATRISATLPPGVHPNLDALGADIAALQPLRRIASLAKRDTGAPGDLTGLVMEYLNLVFYLDGNALLFGRRQLVRNADTLARVIQTVGTVDAAIAVASWRSQHTHWCRPDFSTPDMRISDMWHPLLASPVANSADLTPGEGLIITGSNMSGKTTYLRSVGAAVVMAQTLHTCPATAYSAPRVSVRTSIGRNDSLTDGKSYYLAEAESVLASVTAAQGASPCLFLFDELFRGTNLVERLAAGEAVLRTLLDGSPRHFAIVATHDGELVDLVEGRYRPVHFDGRLEDGVLTFDYQLKPGRATSRNAIALLQQLGAPPLLVQHATKRAAELDTKHPTDTPRS